MNRLLNSLLGLAVAFAGVSALASYVHAESSHASPIVNSLKPVEDRFLDANISHNGMLTQEEADHAMPAVARHFNEIDTEHTGHVTLPQIEAYMETNNIYHY